MKVVNKTRQYFDNLAFALLAFVGSFFGLAKAHRSWWFNILVRFDMLGNAILAGDPEETISSRMGKQIEEGDCPVCKFVCRLIDWTGIDPIKKHCKRFINPNQGDWSDDDDNVIN